MSAAFRRVPHAPWRGRSLTLLFGAMVTSLVLPATALASSTAPALIGAVSNNTSLSGAVSVDVAGNDAFTTAYWPGQVTAVDFSNPSQPTVAGSTTTSATSLQNGSNVAISGNFAFVASKNRNASSSSNDDGSGNSLTVVDISKPASPSVVGSVHDSNKLFGSYGVAVSGHYAYVAYQGTLAPVGQPNAPDTSTGGFSVIDLNNLGAGVVANIDNGSMPSPWTGTNALYHSTSVAISGNYAYVSAFYSCRVTVIDISNPTSPTIAGSLRDCTNLLEPADVAVQGNDLYVADQTGSVTSPQLTVVDVSNPAQPAVIGTLSNANVLSDAYRIRVRGSFAYIAAKNSSAVAAIDISNPAHPRLAGYVQDAAHLYQTSGLALDSTGRYVIANSYEANTEGNLNSAYPPFTATTGTISVIDLIPNPIGVRIAAASEPPSHTSQTSANFGFAPTDDVSALACSLDQSPYGSCTSATTQAYSSLGVGSHTFSVQATDAAGNKATDSYTWTVVPSNSKPPAISGTASQGQQLSVVNGTWSGTPTYSEQWADCDSSGQSCVPIQGATSSTYTLTASDVGHTIEVDESATQAGGTGGPVPSTPTAIVTGPPANAAPPAVSGSAVAGQALSVSTGTWSGYPAPSFTYQWEDCPPAGGACAAIPSATRSSYNLQPSDEGSDLDVLVTASNGIGSPATARSAPSAIVVAPGSAPPTPPSNSLAPQISGPATAGMTLAASAGAWGGTAPITYAYQWQRCAAACTNIAGATGSSYTATSGDVGNQLRVIVTAANSAGSASAGSTQVGPVALDAQQVKTLLYQILSPKGRAARLHLLLKTGSYTFTFASPSAGSLSLTWSLIPNAAHPSRTKHKPIPVKVATVTVLFPSAHTATVTLGLTQAGRKILAHMHLAKLTATASFTSPGGSTIGVPARTFTIKR